MRITAAQLRNAREETMVARMEYDRLQVRFITLRQVAMVELLRAGIKLENKNTDYLIQKLKEQEQ